MPHKTRLWLTLAITLLPLTIWAQPTPHTARSHGMAQAIGAVPAIGDAIFANPAELIGGMGNQLSLSTSRFNYTWSADTMMTVGGENKGAGYTAIYHQPYFGMSLYKGSQEANLVADHPRKDNYQTSDFWSLRAGVCDLSGSDTVFGITGIYQKFEHKRSDNTRQSHSFFSCDAGMTYFQPRYRLGIYVANSLGQKRKTPRFDDYGGVILLEHEPRNLHVSFSISDGSSTILALDVGGLLPREVDTFSIDQEDDDPSPANWETWEVKRSYQIGLESRVSAKLTMRLGLHRAETLQFIDYENRELHFDNRTSYHLGANLTFNRFLTDVAVSYERKPGQFYDETLDTRERIFTLVTTLKLKF